MTFRSAKATRIGIKWGVIFALAVAVWTLLVHLLGIYTYRIQYADLVDRVALVLPLTVFTLALVERRRVDGKLTFFGGILTGLAVAVVAAPLTTATLWLYHHFINPDWLAIVVANQRQRLVAAGLAPEQVAERTRLTIQGGSDSWQILGGIFGTIGVALVMSPVITGALRLQSLWLAKDRNRLPEETSFEQNQS